MYKHHILIAAMSAALMSTSAASAGEIFANDVYAWHGDTITQGEFMAYAPDANTLISTYHAQPRYFMPVANEWHLKNDISAYPQLTTSNRLHQAIYNMGLDEMVNAVEPDTTLRTGKEWAGVWTRDVSYSIILAMAALQPEASRISLERKITPDGRIIQDTGSGGAWPVSTDREVWALAAYELYKVTGDREWLKKIYPVIKRSLEDDMETVYTPGDNLPHGETSFIDWREQSYPKWMQTADIYTSQAMNTAVVHAAAWNVLADIAAELGHKKEAEQARLQAQKVTDDINTRLWNDEAGDYMMYLYGRDYPIVNPRHETLGSSLAILYDIAPEERAKRITESNPVTPFGPAIFYPQIADMPAYHNNALWPFVAAYWTLANAKAGNEEGVLNGIGSIFRPAALFTTNKENFNLDNGDIATELNSSNMLWCLSGNLALTQRILFGINYEKDGIRFAPFVPKALSDTRSLNNYRYRDAILNITVKGYGDRIASFTLNGKEQKNHFVPANIKGVNDIVITMADNNIEPLNVNLRSNLKAPLTPIAWLEGTTLCWNPIEYIGEYIVLRDGQEVARTRSTTFDATVPGEYQVIGVSSDGTQSFASQPRSTRPVNIIDLGTSTKLNSAEVSYKPVSDIAGYQGAGWIETDRTSAPIDIPVTVDNAGKYSLSLRYANGNGPVNTENKCAIRTIMVDGKRVGTVVMPQRGVANWDDWGMTNPVQFDLTPGEHTITIIYRDSDANMNEQTNHALIDAANITLL